MKQPIRKKPAAPWEHAEWNEHVVLAFQALERGTASEPQQKLALDWLLTATLLTEQSFIPVHRGGDPNGRIDAFIEGKRQIGRQVRNFLRLNVKRYLEKEEKEG